MTLMMETRSHIVIQGYRYILCSHHEIFQYQFHSYRPPCINHRFIVPYKTFVCASQNHDIKAERSYVRERAYCVDTGRQVNNNHDQEDPTTAYERPYTTKDQGRYKHEENIGWYHCCITRSS